VQFWSKSSNCAYIRLCKTYARMWLFLPDWSWHLESFLLTPWNWQRLSSVLCLTVCVKPLNLCDKIHLGVFLLFSFIISLHFFQMFSFISVRCLSSIFGNGRVSWEVVVVSVQMRQIGHFRLSSSVKHWAWKSCRGSEKPSVKRRCKFVGCYNSLVHSKNCRPEPAW
jgi:hypothetical protein